MFKSYVYVVCSVMLFALSACQNGDASSAQNANGADSKTNTAKSLMDQLDEKLADYYLPAGTETEGLNPRLYALNRSCDAAGGEMNPLNNECSCQGVALFTTAAEFSGITYPTCAPISIAPTGIRLTIPTGLYGDAESHRMMLQDSADASNVRCDLNV